MVTFTINIQGYQQRIILRGVFRNLSKGGGLEMFSFHGGAKHPLGPENPLKSIDFTGPGGA